MVFPRQWLFAGGLVVLTGPLCLAASAQGGYVDLEAEAAAREAAGLSAPEDPYGTRPTQSYPATSYGVGSAPTAPGSAATTPAATPGTTGTVAAPAAGGGLGNLVLQVQQLQQEVMRLNGKVEEQAHELRQLQEQSLQRYMDLDKRLSSGALAGGEGGSAQAAGGPGAGSQPAGISATGQISAPGEGAAASGAASPGAASPGEKAAYDAAYALVVGRQFDQAVPAFQQFLRDYPGGRFAANAHYWLGELYLVIEPPDLEASRQAFALLISEYPDNPKAADALYKLGKVQYMKGNREKAREYLELVISQYESSDPAVVKLAREFIAQNY